MDSLLITLQGIRSVFGDETAVSYPIIPEQRCAAVAMIFNEFEEELKLCFGLRATFEGDPWSGDMAFPGGKAEVGDQTFHDIAVRETVEETGLRLTADNLIGALEPLETFGNEKRPSLFLRPMIYALEKAPVPFQISSELEAAYWIPVSHLWDINNWQPNYVTWRDRQFPGIQYQPNVIWGLTLRILMTFGQKISVPLHSTLA